MPDVRWRDGDVSSVAHGGRLNTRIPAPTISSVKPRALYVDLCWRLHFVASVLAPAPARMPRWLLGFPPATPSQSRAFRFQFPQLNSLRSTPLRSLRRTPTTSLTPKSPCPQLPTRRTLPLRRSESFARSSDS